MKRILIQGLLALGMALAVLVPAAASPSAQTPPPETASLPSTVRFNTLDVEAGLSQSSVYAIFQDQQGFLWFGTDDGLNRYDGYAFEVFRHDPENPSALRNNSVRSLYQSRDGSLWIGTKTGLDRFEDATTSFVHYHDTPENAALGAAVLAIVEDEQGLLWVGLDGGGLALLDQRSGKFIHLRYEASNPDSLSNDHVTALAISPVGEFWVGTADGLNRYDRASGTFRRYLHNALDPNSIGGDEIRSIFISPNDQIWVATDDGGLSRYDRSTDSFVRFPVADDNPFALSSNSVRGLAQDRAGHLWVGTRRGIDQLTPEFNRFEHYRHDPADLHSVASDSILSVLIDRSGVLWVGTQGGGISVYSPYANKFTTYQHSPGRPNHISNNMVSAVYEDSTGLLWVGTLEGGLNRINRRTGELLVFRHDIRQLDSLSSNDVRAVLEDYNGTLWVGTAGGGLDRYHPRAQTFSHHQHAPDQRGSLSDNTVTVLYEDSVNNLWVGTQSGGLNLYNRATGRFDRFLHDPQVPTSINDNHVQAIFEDDEGYLWVGTPSGLNRMQIVSGRFRAYEYDPRNPNSLSANNVLSIYQDSIGTLWIGTQSGGLNRFDWETGTFQHYTEKDGLANDTVYAILEDDIGNLWLSTNRGLSRFDPRTDTFRNFDIKDGLQSNEFNPGAAFHSRGGEMFFGGVNGLNIFDPQNLPTNPNPPPVVVTAYKEFNQTRYRSLVDGQTIELPYTVNFISFEFVALDFNAPGKNQYAYRLEGFDKDWVMAGNRRYVNYTNLTGGDYVFRVRGANNDGVWNEQGISLNIQVIPPFWQRWWFVALVSVALGAIVWGGYYLRVKSVEALNRQLERQVRERTQEIERRREVAEGLRDIIAILNSNRALQDSLDYIIHQVVRIMSADSAVLFEHEPRSGVKIIAGSAEGCVLLGGDERIPAWVSERILSDQSLVITSVEAYRQRYRLQLDLPAGADCALLAMPLAIGGSATDGGLVLVFREPHQFTDEDIKTASMFADQAALAIANARLRAHAEELAVSAERSRLARDLHDAVTQTLFATSLISEVLPRIWDKNPEEGRRRLLEVRELTRGALAEMRTLLMELRPSALLDAPLGELLHQLCDAFRGRARVPVSFAGDDEAPPLEPDAQVVFYRIAQEALNNVAKHARANQVNLRLVDDGSQVVLEIHDDGVGFDTGVVKPDHFGLSIMRERAQTIGAVCAITSAPGEGTRVLVEWRRSPSLPAPQPIAEPSQSS